MNFEYLKLNQVALLQIDTDEQENKMQSLVFLFHTAGTEHDFAIVKPFRCTSTGKGREQKDLMQGSSFF